MEEENKTKTEKKIIIDLNSKEMIKFEGILGVNDSIQLLKCLGELTTQMNEHLTKVVMASYITLAQKIKLEVELSDMEEGESKISNKRFIEIVEEITK
jgi:hypothetical protein